MSIYEATDHATLRAAVVALCVAALERWRDTGDWIDDAAERIVPPVPTPPLRSVAVASLEHVHTITYQHDKWVLTSGANGMDTVYDDAMVMMADQINCLWTPKIIGMLLDLKANPVKESPTPATVASEPAAWMNKYLGDSDFVFHATYEKAVQCAMSAVVEIAVPLYRHPATEAGALAVLVGAGWMDTVKHEHANSGTLRPVATHTRKPVRVLIAPEGK